MSRELDRVEELRRAFDRSFADAPATAPDEQLDLLAIRVAGEQYAVHVHDVRELLRCRTLIAVPSNTPALLGLSGVRGGIVPVFGLAELLGHAIPTAAPDWMVITGGDDPIGLAFDELERHLRVPDAAVHDGDAVRLDDAVRPVIRVAQLVASLRKER